MKFFRETIDDSGEKAITDEVEINLSNIEKMFLEQKCIDELCCQMLLENAAPTHRTTFSNVFCGKAQKDEFRKANKKMFFCNTNYEVKTNKGKTKERIICMDDNIIVLNDEDGNEAKFEFLDLIPYQGYEYVVFLPVNDDADEVVILQLEETSDNSESYLGVEDESILSAVFDIFKDKYKDEFNFVD